MIALEWVIAALAAAVVWKIGELVGRQRQLAATKAIDDQARANLRESERVLRQARALRLARTSPPMRRP